MKDLWYKTSVFLFFYGFSLYGIIEIDIDLPNDLKDKILQIQNEIQICFKNVGCFPNKVAKNDLHLTVQFITDKNLTEREIENLKIAVQNAAQHMEPVDITQEVNNSQFQLIPYKGGIVSPRIGSRMQQFPGAFLAFCLDNQSRSLKNLIALIDHELTARKIAYDKRTECNVYIPFGFTRFVKVRDSLSKVTVAIPKTSNFIIDKLSITKTGLRRQLDQFGDRILISKNTLATYQFPQQISEEQNLRNNLVFLKNDLQQLKDTLITLSQ